MDFVYKGIEIAFLKYADFKEYLIKNGSVSKADFDRKIIKTDREIAGLNSAQITALVKYYKKSDCALLYSYPRDDLYETLLLQGIVGVSDKRQSIGFRKDFLLKIIPYFDNWAYCDQICSKIFIEKANREDVFHFACDLINRTDEFGIRSGIIIMLSTYLDEEHIEEIFSNLRGIKTGEYYYVDMAIAWLCATALIRFKSETLRFLTEAPNVNDFTYVTSLRKARESFRIPDEDKEFYKTLISARKGKK